MNFIPQEPFNPGIIEYDEKRHKQIQRFKEAVERAKFLNKSEKRNWTLLGYLLTNQQLLKAERLIISEDLRRMKVKKELEVIKPKEKKHA